MGVLSWPHLCGSFPSYCSICLWMTKQFPPLHSAPLTKHANPCMPPVSPRSPAKELATCALKALICSCLTLNSASLDQLIEAKFFWILSNWRLVDNRKIPPPLEENDHFTHPPPPTPLSLFPAWRRTFQDKSNKLAIWPDFHGCESRTQKSYLYRFVFKIFCAFSTVNNASLQIIWP